MKTHARPIASSEIWTDHFDSETLSAKDHNHAVNTVSDFSEHYTSASDAVIWTVITLIVLVVALAIDAARQLPF